ncbi:hypothetical protein CBOM_08071 [Ceraceosorus bombacis]|uniref:Uncharacterized protein n=1 Tax=Ceraceosorus bombacis TaxID=401625 RepID=A0A0P1BSR5_9BASI|nr:hypothetical protein CBOM_08071 [Ceraceosorus bombacis]
MAPLLARDRALGGVKGGLHSMGRQGTRSGHQYEHLPRQRPASTWVMDQPWGVPFSRSVARSSCCGPSAAQASHISNLSSDGAQPSATKSLGLNKTSTANMTPVQGCVQRASSSDPFCIRHNVRLSINVTASPYTFNSHATRLALSMREGQLTKLVAPFWR